MEDHVHVFLLQPFLSEGYTETVKFSYSILKFRIKIRFFFLLICKFLITEEWNRNLSTDHL